jgi:hypothetical protein
METRPHPHEATGVLLVSGRADIKVVALNVYPVSDADSIFTSN